MKQIPADLHKIIEFGLGGDSWQSFVDRYEEKYNNVNIDGFDFEPTRINYTWSQLIADVAVNTLPAYVDPESPGYEKALNEVKGQMGSIPTQKAFYSLNRSILREKLQLIDQFGDAAMNAEMQKVFLGLIDEGTDGLIGGYYNSLTHQRMQIVSTGKFVINTVNNPRGLKGVSIEFGVPASNFDTLATTKRWWTTAEHTVANQGSASDPLGYLKDKKRAIGKKIAVHLEISDDLWQDMLTHTKVLEKIGRLNNVTVDSADNAVAIAMNMDDAALKAAAERIIGCPIVVRDSIAYVDTPNAETHKLERTQIDNFNPKNIAFVPNGRIGSIQGVAPLTLGYDADKVAKYNEGRLVLTQRPEPKNHAIYIESEAAQICVPSMPQYMWISTVTA